MGFIKWLLWTSFSIGFGIFLATYKVEGRTPWDYLTQHAPQQARLDQIKDAVIHEAGDAKAAVEAQVDKSARPKERHSPEDRAQVNKLISKRATGT